MQMRHFEAEWNFDIASGVLIAENSPRLVADNKRTSTNDLY